ncbi:hemolysin family protein [Cryptosporangium aurantiacum]|uniref:Hemolysin, contains CBS domains n=1 Tax=Cryptosporangium aurantiacum TaxID=134849 RepID=A0A1M7Q5K4_9ACTN|nr:hemolysin family protein [Cryptosporangium aurantiacum]SHN25686.1 Hemolysin, contains CBS domains [Cryptosporangium aurantiacum]
MSTPGLLAAAAGLVVVAGAVAAADTAFNQISRARAEEMQRAGTRGAANLVALVGNLPVHVSLLLLIRLACELTATTLVALVAIDRWGPGWVAALVTAGSMTVVSFVLVGVGPRTIGRLHPYPVALASAGITRWLGRVLNPLARLLILVGNMVTPGRGFREGPFATETELRELVDLAEERGVVESDEREMIHSVFELGDTIVREVMVPRPEIVWIEGTKTVRQATSLALRSGFSRIPVLGESIDDIVGVAYLKDMVRRVQGQPEADRQIRVEQVMRDAEFVPESKPAADLLREMQQRRIHMAIVIDEYGGTAGVVTIEDILEEIVGEIADEYDNERPPVEELDDGSVRVTARLAVEDLGELLDVELPDYSDDIETVGGLLAHELGKVPIPGASVRIQDLELTAESAGGRRNRIDTVLVRRLEPQPQNEEEPSEETRTADV